MMPAEAYTVSLIRAAADDAEDVADVSLTFEMSKSLPMPMSMLMLSDTAAEEAAAPHAYDDDDDDDDDDSIMSAQ